MCVLAPNKFRFSRKEKERNRAKLTLLRYLQLHRSVILLQEVLCLYLDFSWLPRHPIAPLRESATRVHYGPQTAAPTAVYRLKRTRIKNE